MSVAGETKPHAGGAPSGPRQMPICTLCKKPLGQPGRTSAPGSLPRVEVRNRRDVYEAGGLEAIFHPECWPIVRAALPVLQLLREEGIEDATAFITQRAAQLVAEASA